MSKRIQKAIGRQSYTPEFKKQAIILAEELGSIPEAAEKLGIKSVQTLALDPGMTRRKAQIRPIRSS